MFDPRERSPLTFDDAARLDPDEQPGELDAGQWTPVTRSTWRHGMIVGNAYALLRAYSKVQPGWSVSVGDPGVKLGASPDTLRGPDVAMVRVERQPQGKGSAGWLQGAPEIVVEVIGDGQSVSELTRKALQYLSGGARTVWVLDPDPARLLVFTPPDHVQVLGAADTLDGGTALPDFRCSVSEFFE